MKNFITSFIVVLLIKSATVNGQTYVWNQKANFGGGKRSGVSAFSVGTKGYFGFGIDDSLISHKDLWEYDPLNNTWTQKASLPGLTRHSACGFTINNMGYICLGWEDTQPIANQLNDLWQYDPANNSWSQKSSFPGGGRYCASVFTIGNKAYVGLGYKPIKNDFYEYDASNDTWTILSNPFPGAGRTSAAAFSITYTNGSTYTKGYVSCGSWNDNGSQLSKDLWEFTPGLTAGSGTWLSKANLPGQVRYAPFAFSVNGKGYLGAGIGSISNGLNDFYEYDPVNNSWATKPAFPGTNISSDKSFTIGNIGYLGTGQNSSGTFYDIFWEYAPITCGITGSGVICTGSTQWCAPAGLTSYLWSTGASTQCITLTNAGTYTLTITDVNGSTSSCSKSIIVSSTPTCLITGNGTICSGSSTQWCASAGFSSYLWSTGATTQCTAVSTGGLYRVTVTNASGCTSSCSKTLTSTTVPCYFSGDNVLCPGGSTQWCAPAGLFSYLWNTGATTQCTTVSAGSTYTITVTDTSGCSCTYGEIVFTDYPPSCSITGNATICGGASTQWCAPTGYLYTYLWNTGATTKCITVSVAGTYTVSVANSNGCSSTCSKTLVVSGTAPSCTVTGSGTICSGGSAQWCAPAGLTSYLWNNSTTTQCRTLSSAGTYTVTVTNSTGCSSTCSQTLNISSPVCSITGSGTTCPGNSTQWCAPVGLASYLWSTGATTQCVTLNSAGSYTITITEASGCSSTCSNTLIIAPPTCLITGSGAICSGSSIQWCAPAGLSSYLWSTGATTQCITLSSAGNYTVTVTDAGGCSSTCSKTLAVNTNPVCSITGSGSICSGSSTQWCAPAGLTSYLWNTGATTQCVTLNSAGNYTVTVTNASGCSSTCSKTLAAGSAATCSITGSGSVCSGSSAQWCAPAGLSSYLWSTGATTQCIAISAAGNYTVTVANSGGCTSSCSQTLVVSGTAPTCSITGSGTICSGSSTQWCAPAGLTSYLWNNGSTAQCRTLNTSGTYTVTVTNSTGCTSSCTKKLTVGGKPAKPGTITATGGNTKVCSGDSKTYSISAVSGAVSYTWTPPVGGVIASGQGTTSVTVNFTSGFVTDSIKVAAVNSCGVTGDYRALKITKGNPPAKPGNVTGQLFGVCGNSGVPYSVTNVAGVTYNWTLSNTNTSIAGGQGTSSCTVNFSPTLSGAISLIVTPSNSCGTGAHSGIVILAGPDKPVNITGATTVCANQAGVPYAIAPIAGAVNYTWVAPTGGHVSDGSVTSAGTSLLTTATNVTVNFGSTSGNVKVRGNNACGHGDYKTLAVTFNCREANSSSSFEVNLFPNPADDELTVSFNSITNSSYSIKVNDIIGNTLLVKTGVSEKGENSFKLSLEDITPGVYLVEIKNGDRSRVMKLVVN